MKTQFLINRKCIGARLDELLCLINAEFVSSEIQISVCDHRSATVALAAAAAADGSETVVAVGGDGTVNAALNGIAGSTTRLGIIPVGTANDLAHQLGVPADLKDALVLIKSGTTCVLDAIRVNGCYYLTVGGLLLPADVANTADRLRHGAILGKLASRAVGAHLYSLALLLTYRRSTRRSRRIAIATNGCSQQFDTYSVIVANQPRTGRDFEVCPSARANDGIADFFLITNHCSRADLRRTILATRNGSHTANANVVLLRDRAARISCAEPLEFFGDGETLLFDREFAIDVCPGAVRIIAPASAERSNDVR